MMTAPAIVMVQTTRLDPVKDIDRIVTYTAESVEAPVEKGAVLGQITLQSGDTVYGTVDLLADEDVSVSIV